MNQDGEYYLFLDDIGVAYNQRSIVVKFCGNAWA